MSIVRFSPCSLRDVTVWVTAKEEGFEWKERILPIGHPVPEGWESLGKDHEFELWRHTSPILRPLRYDLISNVSRKGDKYNERYYQFGGYKRGCVAELSQHSKDTVSYTLPHGDQLDGIPDGWAISSRLRRKHHSITEVQDAGVFGVFDKTVDVTLSSSITTGNTLIGCAAYSAGHPLGTPNISFSASNTAGSYTQAHINLCGNFYGVNQWIAYRTAGASEGTQQNLVVIANNTDNTNWYVVEVSEIVSVGVVDGSARTQDDFSGATSQSTGTTGTLSSGDKYVVYFYALGAGTSSGSYSGTPPTEKSALNGTYLSSRVATEVVTPTTGVSNTYSWTTSVQSAGMVVAFLGDTAGPPVNTVPSDGLQFTSASYTTIPGISVAEGSESITSIVLSTAGEGEGLLSASAAEGISITGIGTTTLTGTTTGTTSEAQWNTFLSGVEYKGATGLHGADVISMTSSDGTTSDVDTFEVINDPTHLLLTASGTYAQIVTAVESTIAMLISGESGDVTMTTTDTNATPKTDVDTFTVSLIVEEEVTAVLDYTRIRLSEVLVITPQRELHKVYARSEQPGSIKRSTGHGHTVS